MSKIKLNSGKFWDFVNPKQEDVDIHDIMHNLVKEQRFSNCLDQKWSVMDHSMLVLFLVKEGNGTPYQQYQALLHDTPEAYLGDVPTPLKSLLRDYQKFYFRTEAVLETKFGVNLGDLDPMVRTADRTAMLIEDVLLCNTPSEWHDFTYESYYELNTKLENRLHDFIVTQSSTSHYMKKQRFFARFKELQQQIGRDFYESQNNEVSRRIRSTSVYIVSRD